jgi:phosphoglycerate kinase
VEKDFKGKCLEIQQIAKDCGVELIIPTSVVVAKSLQEPNYVREIDLRYDKIEPEEMIVDAGTQAVETIINALKMAKMVVWNGPIGMFEIPPFDKGTRQLALGVAKMTSEGGLESVIGGGDTASAIHKFELKSHFTHISTGGGAFLEWLEGLGLPGIEALQK